MQDGGERLFGSTLAQDEAPQPRGLLSAGLLLIANAAIASITAAFAPRFGLGAAWTQWMVIAIDLLLGALLALRQERVAVVARPLRSGRRLRSPSAAACSAGRWCPPAGAGRWRC